MRKHHLRVTQRDQGKNRRLWIDKTHILIKKIFFKGGGGGPEIILRGYKSELRESEIHSDGRMALEKAAQWKIL